METEEMVFVRKQLEEAVTRGEAINRLIKNKDFKSIILESYLKDTLIGLGHQLSSQYKPEMRQAITEQILSRGNLQSFLQMMLDDAARASNELSELGA